MELLNFFKLILLWNKTNLKKIILKKIKIWHFKKIYILIQVLCYNLKRQDIEKHIEVD